MLEKTQINVDIKNINNVLVVSSQVVARELNKQHKKVCDKINEVLRISPNLATPIQKDFEAIETTSINTQNKQKYKEYLLSKDGFTLLVMNYTGYNDFKRAYIKRFNEMEQQLKHQQLGDTYTYYTSDLISKDLINLDIVRMDDSYNKERPCYWCPTICTCGHCGLPLNIFK